MYDIHTCITTRIRHRIRSGYLNRTGTTATLTVGNIEGHIGRTSICNQQISCQTFQASYRCHCCRRCIHITPLNGGIRDTSCYPRCCGVFHINRMYNIHTCITTYIRHRIRSGDGDRACATAGLTAGHSEISVIGTVIINFKITCQRL